jgi:hypothetical protein
MPSNGPGLRQDSVATKAVLHGDPCVETGFPGVAFKNAQINRYVDPISTAARQVQVGESFTIMLGGTVEVKASLFPGGLPAAVAGEPVYIRAVDNVLLTDHQSPSEGVDEIQSVTVTGAPTGGTYTLTFAGQTTAAIAYNATAAAVQAALESLSNIGVGSVAVTGSTGGPYTVTFGGQYQNVDVAQLTATASLTGGTSPGVTTATVTSGSALGVFKFGRVAAVVTSRSVVRINTNARDTF